MKIALNALTLPGNLAGIGFYTEQLLRNLVALEPDLEITLFTNRHAAAALGSLGSRIRVEAFGFTSSTGKALAAQFLIPARLSGFDLLHSVGNVGLRKSPIPQVTTIHDLCQRVLPSRFGAMKRAYLDYGEAWSVRQCARIITVSHCTQADLSRFYPEAVGKTVTIHSASKFAIEYGESGDRRHFLFVGTLEPGKNLPMALQALARLRDEHGMVKRLKVVGARGWKQSVLPKLITGLELEAQVSFLGYLDDEALRAEYRSSECLVFPSMYEGFGLPILEAQSQGCPVICADNSSLREIGGAGCRYFSTGDVDALTLLMLESQRDMAGFTGMREEGFANCARFDWSRTARETLAVYRDCLRA